MKRIPFYFLYASTIVPPVLLYLLALGSPGTAYTLSMTLGVCSFMILANQFILASKPAFAVKALGMKGLLSLHSTMPIVAVLFAVAHRALKVGLVESKVPASSPIAARSRPVIEALRGGLGFADDTSQTTPGSIALIVAIALSVVAVVFIANTVFMRIKPLADLKSWVYKKTGLSYRSFRLIHGLVVFSAVALIIHVAMATSGPTSRLPLGFAWSVAWMALALVVFARYKIKAVKAA